MVSLLLLLLLLAMAVCAAGADEVGSIFGGVQHGAPRRKRRPRVSEWRRRVRAKAVAD